VTQAGQQGHKVTLTAATDPDVTYSMQFLSIINGITELKYTFGLFTN